MVLCCCDVLLSASRGPITWRTNKRQLAEAAIFVHVNMINGTMFLPWITRRVPLRVFGSLWCAWTRTLGGAVFLLDAPAGDAGVVVIHLFGCCVVHTFHLAIVVATT